MKNDWFKPEKRRLKKVAKAIDTLVDGNGMEIDPEIKHAVIALNYAGFYTQMSCEGHMDWALPYPWIDISIDRRLVIYLKKFYSKREKSLCSLQLVIWNLGSYYRLQSVNEVGGKEDTITMIRDEKVLKALREEMNAFADFLIEEQHKASWIIRFNKGPTMEDKALPKMAEILNNNGLQITLSTLVKSLEMMIDKRGPSIEGLLILEALKGLLTGYKRRHEEEESSI